MNAADRRRLTPTLGVVAALLALLLIALWVGLGRGPSWRDDAVPVPLPSAKAGPSRPPVPPLQTFADIWQHPLFNPDRQPDRVVASDGEAADAGDLQLTGVILTPDLHMVLLREKSSGRTLRVQEGQAAGNGGPMLVELHPRSAVIETSGSRQQLQLRPGPGPGTTGGGQTGEDNPEMGSPTAGQPRAMFSPSGAGGVQAAMSKEKDQAARVRALKARIEARRRAAQQKDGG